MVPVAAGEPHLRAELAERAEIDRAIRAAEQPSRYEFSVFVGAAEGDPRAFAERLHAAWWHPTAASW